MQSLRHLLPLAGPDTGAGNQHGQNRILASKPAKLTALAIFFAICSVLMLKGFFGNVNFSHGSLLDELQSEVEYQKAPERSGNGRLHLLIPATSSNSDLCKLMLSAQVLGYPTPVLINYGDHESEDRYVQHLAKVEGILNYLEHLETSSEFVEDLVLIIDGYDIWFQLRPEILIKRYYALNDAANARAVETYGNELVEKHDIRQTIVFGPDKLCWPVDFSRPACWAVPDSLLPDDAFGPPVGYEDRDKNPSKWLNSGTILGPVSHLKNVFRATLDAINENHVTDSDQFYFANVFGEQEYVRISRKPELKDRLKNITYVDVEDDVQGEQVRLEPQLDEEKAEYHIGLDYMSTIFQTLAFWRPHLVWTREVDSWNTPSTSRLVKNRRQFQLPDDIKQSLSPFEPFKYGLDKLGRPGWSEVELAYNPLTGEFPVILHITGSPDEKSYRAYWWQKLWFQAEAEELRLATLQLDQRRISTETIAGLDWYNAELSDSEDIVAGGKGGAFTDRRGWLSWNRLCANSEEDIYRVHDDEYFHPKPRPVTEDTR